MLKVQKIDTQNGERYLLLDDNYRPIDEVKRYLKFCDAAGKSPNTLKSYAADLKIFYSYMSAVNIPIKNLCSMADKGPIDILSDFMIFLQYPDTVKGILHIGGEEPARANGTVNHIMDTVLAFYQFLSANNEIEELPVYKSQRTNERFKSFLSELVHNKTEMQKSIFKKTVPETPIKYITRAQYNELFGLCTCRRDKLLLAILYECGLRLNEGLGIHICDMVNIEDHGALSIVPRENNENRARVKRYAAGTVFMPDYAVDLALDYLNQDILEYDSDFLFLTLHGPTAGQPLKDKNIEHLFERLSRNVGYHVTPHMLRHGFATEKLNDGWEMVDIQAYLRHKNIQSTQIYAAYTDELKKKKMSSFFASNTIVPEEYKNGK